MEPSNSLNNMLPLLSISELFKDKSTSDISFIFPNELAELCKCDCACETSVTIPAHRMILSLGSPVFQRMFTKSDASEPPSQIQIMDTTASAFSEFLQVFYLTKVTLTPGNIAKVLCLLSAHEMVDSFMVCDQFMMESVSVENCLDYLQLTLKFNLSIKLLGTLRRFIRENVTAIFATDTFRCCSPAILKNILELYDLKCKEDDVFYAAMDWARMTCLANDVERTDEERRKALGECFYLIRFPTMSVGEFARCLAQYPSILNIDELLDILQYLTSRKPLTVARSFSSVSRLIV